MKEKKQKQQDDLDMETTFADMNVDGMPWYNPSKKKEGSKDGIQLTRAEKWAMFKAGFIALIPYVLGVAGAFLLIFAILALWLN